MKADRKSKTDQNIRTLVAAVILMASVLVRDTCDAYQFSSSFSGTSVVSSTRTRTRTPRARRQSSSGLPTTLSPMSMKLRVGILGLPNVGKSSLFNALARQSLAQAANFPFCTIDPTTCRVPCPDPYLDRLADWQSSSPNDSRRNRVPATMEWVDVAGLAKNAHRGEGLGNQFLGTLRDCTCLCHVVRAFEDPSILVHHIEEEEEEEDQGDDNDPSKTPTLCDPLRDLETIQLELLLADLAHVQRRLERISGPNSKEDDQQEDERLVLEQLQIALQDGIPARALGLSAEEQFLIKSMGLLTLKPVVYAFNVDEVDFFLNRQEAEETAQRVVQEFEASFFASSPSTNTENQNDHGNDKNDPCWALVCANVESRLSQCTEEEQAEYLESIGATGTTTATTTSATTEEASPTTSTTVAAAPTVAVAHSLCYQLLPNLVRKLLGYSIVFTGPGVPLERSQTTRAHLISSSSSAFTAYDLAGRIHGDIQKGFLRAQVVGASDLLEDASDFVQAKELGILRAEGKDYVLQDQEVVLLQWKGG